jgi:putative drug exporter of the RND superfamily
MFGRLGAWAHRRRRLVVAIWLLAVVAGGAAFGSIGSAFSTEFSLPDVESRRGFDILEAEMAGSGSGVEGTIVFRSETGFEDPSVRSAIDGFLGEIDARERTTVESPFADETSSPSAALIEWYMAGAAEVGPEAVDLLAGTRSERVSTASDGSGQIAYASIEIPSETDMAAAMEVGEEVRALAPDVPGLQIEYGGSIFQEFEPPAAELIGLAFAIVILIVAFGSVLAMGLPIGWPSPGIGIGSGCWGCSPTSWTMPDFATFARHHDRPRRRHRLRPVHRDAVPRAAPCRPLGRRVDPDRHRHLGSSGLFAGITVVISLLGMLLMGVSFVNGLAIGAATMVAVTMVASLTLLPALLGFAGDASRSVGGGASSPPGSCRSRCSEPGCGSQPLLLGVPLAAIVLLAGFAVAPLRREVPRRPPKPLRDTFAYRWSRFVQTRPWTLALGATAALVLLAVPMSQIRLGFSDAGNAPLESSERKAYDLLADGFGPGYNGRILLVAEVPDGVDLTSSAQLFEISGRVAATEGVASVSPPVPNDMDDPASSTAVLWQVFPETAPQDEATTELVRELRESVLPSASEGTGVEVLVTGMVGMMVDFSDYLADRLLVFFAAVLSLSFLLLMIVFRSILVPIKAVVMNLLSIGAAYGVIVAIFQWGWLKDVFGVEPAPIEPFIPMMLFAIVFGLSMDYEVFLLSRIREEWLRTGDSRRSVADGLAATARVISAAAAIMIVVFGSFLLESDRTIKLMGFGLALAVLLDATVVRMLLVPATMELLGDKNWWFPRWLDRLLPRINVEGDHEQAHGPDAEPAERVDPGGGRELEPTH